jgi:hypothetical protein
MPRRAQYPGGAVPCKRRTRSGSLAELILLANSSSDQRVCHQLGERRCSRLRTGLVQEPTAHTDDVHGSGRCQMLQVRRGCAALVRAPSAERQHSLGDRPLAPSAPRVPGLELLRRLTATGCLQSPDWTWGRTVMARRAAGVQSARLAQDWQSRAENLILMTSLCPRSTAGVHLELHLAAGHMACWWSQSMTKSSAANPAPALACQR